MLTDPQLLYLCGNTATALRVTTPVIPELKFVFDYKLNIEIDDCLDLGCESHQISYLKTLTRLVQSPHLNSSVWHKSSPI